MKRIAYKVKHLFGKGTTVIAININELRRWERRAGVTLYGKAKAGIWVPARDLREVDNETSAELDRIDEEFKQLMSRANDLRVQRATLLKARFARFKKTYVVDIPTEAEVTACKKS